MRYLVLAVLGLAACNSPTAPPAPVPSWAALAMMSILKTNVQEPLLIGRTRTLISEILVAEGHTVDPVYVSRDPSVVQIDGRYMHAVGSGTATVVIEVLGLVDSTTATVVKTRSRR